jgi:membrane dipeptidase
VTKFMHHSAKAAKALLCMAVLSVSLLAGCSNDSAMSNGTAPQESTDAEAFLAKAQAIHAAALTLDAHADIEMPGKPSSYVGADGLSKVAPEKMLEGGLDSVVMSVAVSPGPRTPEGYAAAQKIAAAKLAVVKAMAADTANNTVLVLTPDALISAHEAGQSALLLGFQNALILGTDASAIDAFYADGVRLFALTHMGHNAFADSSRPLFSATTGQREATAEHGGLSELGVTAIKKINALGAIVDISQLSKQAALQAIELSTTPVVASHSNARALTQVSRNLSDEELDRIGATGGVVHVAPFKGYLFDTSNPQMDADIRAIRREANIDEDYLYPFELYWEINDPEVKKTFLTKVSALLGPISLEDMLNHLDYIAKRIGVDHVGIGTDFNHGSGIPGYEDASEALNVTIGLLKRGYSAQDIEKIWGGNFIRVWREAEASAQ